METAFVGRRAELRSLSDAISASWRERSPRVVAVVGEAGAGKSRLLAELERREAPSGQVLRIVGRQPEASVPLAASRDLLRVLATAPGDGGRLQQLVFDPQPGQQDLGRLRVLEAAHRCTSQLGRILLLADDVQWIDDPSRALLHYLVSAAGTVGLPLAAVLATRPSAVSVSLLDSLRRELPDDRIQRLELGPLDRDDALELVRSVDAGLGTEEAEALWRATGGSPFWLVQQQHASGDTAFLVSDRLRALPLDAAAVLAVLAVAGRPLAVDDLAAIREWSATRVAAAARGVIDVGLARSTAGGGLELVHDLIREGALHSLAETERRSLHRRLAGHLEARAGEDITVLREVLHHRLAAGDRVVDVALRLASAPQRRLFGVDGLRELGEVADAAPDDDADAVRLQEALAGLAVDLGEDEIACHRWQLVASASADTDQRARALAAAVRASVDLGDGPRATDLIGRARQVGIVDPAIAVDVDAAAAIVACWADHEPSEAVTLAEQALAAARTAVASAGGHDRADERLRRAYVAALFARYDAAQMLNDDTRLLPLADELVQASARLGPLHFAARLRRGACLRYVGRTREAATALEPLWAESLHRILPASAVQAGCELATARYQLGELSAAAAIAVEAEALGRRTGHLRYRSLLRRLLLRLELHTGDWAAALAGLEHELTEEPSDHLRVGVHEELAAWTARLRGASASSVVEAHLDRARALDAAIGCRRCGEHLRWQTVEALARVGRPDAAAAAVPPEGELGRPPRGLAGFARERALAVLAAASGAEDAETLLQRVASEAEARGWLLEAIWAGLDLARFLTDRGNATLANERAATLAEAIGAVTEQRVAEQQLRGLGVRTWKRTGARPTSTLSPREAEIAEYVARGASNPEIAAALFLSRKTIERHISNILAKLGVRNRTELAGLIGGEGPGGGEVRELPDDAPAGRP